VCLSGKGQRKGGIEGGEIFISRDKSLRRGCGSEARARSWMSRSLSIFSPGKKTRIIVERGKEDRKTQIGSYTALLGLCNRRRLAAGGEFFL